MYTQENGKFSTQALQQDWDFCLLNAKVQRETTDLDIQWVAAQWKNANTLLLPSSALDWTSGDSKEQDHKGIECNGLEWILGDQLASKHMPN